MFPIRALAIFALSFAFQQQGFAAPSAAKAPPDYTAIAASTMLGDPNAYKMVYMATIRHAADMEIAAGHYSQADADALRQRMNEAGLANINGEHWNDWTVAALKDGAAVGAGIAGGEIGMPIPTNLLNKGIDTILKDYESDGKTPVQDPKIIQTVTTWMLHAAKDPRNPDHVWAADQVKTYLKLDPSVDYAFLPGVQDKIQIQELKDLISDLQNQIKNHKEGQSSDEDEATLKRQEARAQALMGYMLKQFQAAHQEIFSRGNSMSEIEKKKRLAHAKELKEQFNEYAKAFGNLTGIAVLTHSPEAAKFFHNAQQLSESIGKIIEVSLTKTFSEEPLAYTNVYMAAALLVVNMMNESNEQTAQQQMHDMLVNIAKELDQFRSETHAHLDKLELKADEYYRVSLADLTNLTKTTNQLQTLANNLTEQIRQNDYETTQGLKFIIQMNNTSWQSNCISNDLNGKYIRRKTTQIIDCRNQVAQLATSTWDRPITNPDSNSPTFQEWAKLSDQEYLDLKSLLSTQDPSQPLTQSKVHPFNYIYGARMFVKLFEKNPSFKAYAPNSQIDGRDDLSLASLIRVGKQSRDSLSQLVLNQQSQGFSLKKDLLNAVLKQYKAESINAVNFGEDMAQRFSFNGPRPSLGGVGDAIPVIGDYPFLQKKIGMCDRKDANVSGGSSPGFSVANIYYTFRSSDPTNMYFANWIAFGTDTIPEFSWNQTFLPVIPPEMVWASRMRDAADNLDITPCFRHIHYSNMVDAVAGLRFTVHVDLEFRGTTNETRLHGGQDFLISKAAMDWDYGQASAVQNIYEIFQNMWYGQSCPNGVCNFNWKAVSNEGAKWFIPVKMTTAQMDPLYLKYKEKMDRLWATNTDAGIKAIETYYRNKSGLNAKRELLLLANLGLDQSVPEAKSFVDWLLYPDSLSSQEELAKYAFSSDTPSDAIAAIVDAKVALAQQQLDKLSEVKTLRPRQNDVDPLLNKLIMLNGGKAAGTSAAPSTLRQWYDNFMSKFD